MIGLLAELEIWRWLHSTSPTQWMLRLSIAVATALAVVVTAAAGGRTPTLWIVLLVVATVWTVAMPDSTGPALLITLLVVGWWVLVERESGATGWLVVEGLAILVIHSAAAMAASAPAAARIRVDGFRRWAAPVALTGGLMVAACLVLAALEGAPTRGSTIRMAAALLGVAALAWYVRRTSVDDPEAGWSRANDRP